jgi:hypothetical protein
MGVTQGRPVSASTRNCLPTRFGDPQVRDLRSTRSRGHSQMMVVAGMQHPDKIEHGCDLEPQKASNRRFLTKYAWFVSIAT